MKRLMLGALVLILLASCSALFQPDVYITFADVSQPYLDRRGPPEEVSTYTSADYKTVDWWWWTQGFEVTFLDTIWDDVNGWTVDSEYTFEPIP